MAASYTPMIKQYLEIKAQVPDAFLFFRLGDFYELFFDDAKLAATELEITLTGRDGGGNERIPMCGVPYHSAESYIERLIERGYKVAICEQVENPAQAKGVVKREIVRIITPGTVMEETMLEEKENNFLAALFPLEQQIGLALVDLSTGELHLTEVPAEVNAVVDELISYQPKEVVVEERMPLDDPLLQSLKQRSSMLITPFPLKVEDERVLEEQFPTYQQVCTSPCLKAVMQLIYGYIQQTQKRSLQHIGRLSRYDPKQFMVLDEAAKRNLELHQTLQEGKKKGSLFWLLDRTATAMGGRLLKKWLNRPLLARQPILARQQAVQAFLDDPLMLDEIVEMLRSVYDMERLAARIAYGSATPRDLVALKQSLSRIPELQKRLLEQSTTKLHSLGEAIDPCQEVKQLIERALIDEPPLTIKEGGLIRTGFHEELDQYRTVQKEGKEWIAKLEQEERKKTGIKSLKVRYNRNFGYFIEVTKSNLRYLPEGRYQRKQTLTNAERFITPELKEREQMILQAEERSVELEQELFHQVRQQVAEQVERLQRLAESIAELDCYQSLASVARQRQYTCPQLTEDGRLLIQTGRHPVVEAVTGENEFVANDVELDYKERQILLITGPNMAGKSTYMRQVALIAIMAQIGSYVPAERAEIGLIDRIFTRIGAADDLVGGRSTFMVEMTETCRALQEATPRSLLLLDEVGRGTSTYDGMALAHAIIEYIHDQLGAKTLFSTHYHELTQLEQSLERVKNIHAECIEQDGRVVFLHRMIPGGADRSYGIHVAELAGLPAAVIERAKSLLTQLEDRSKDTVNPPVKEKQVQEHQVQEQISFFEMASTHETTAAYEQAVDELLSWDVLNHTPLETMQFISQLQQSLRNKK